MNQSGTDMELPGENEAVSRAIESGAMFGYGNMIAHLAREWAERLVRDGLSEETAIRHVSNRGPYPLRPDKLNP